MSTISGTFSSIGAALIRAAFAAIVFGIIIPAIITCGICCCAIGHFLTHLK